MIEIDCENEIVEIVEKVKSGIEEWGKDKTIKPSFPFVDKDIQNTAIIENELIDMPNEEYHSHREYISASQIKDLLKNPYLYFHPQPQDQKYVFDIGSLIHTLILEPEKFEEGYILSPKYNKRTINGKKDWVKFKENNQDRIIIEPDDFENCIALQKAVLDIPEVISILKGGVSEKSYFKTLEDGTKVKVRPDRMKNERVCIDVKSCVNASPDAFKRDIAKYGYHIQAAHYSDTLGLNKFIFLAIEKKPPFMTGIYELTNADRDLGRDLIKRALLISKQPEKYKYPIYNVDSKLITLALPNYVHYQNENLD